LPGDDGGGGGTTPAGAGYVDDTSDEEGYRGGGGGAANGMGGAENGRSNNPLVQEVMQVRGGRGRGKRRGSGIEICRLGGGQVLAQAHPFVKKWVVLIPCLHSGWGATRRPRAKFDGRSIAPCNKSKT